MRHRSSLLRHRLVAQASWLWRRQEDLPVPLLPLAARIRSTVRATTVTSLFAACCWLAESAAFALDTNKAAKIPDLKPPLPPLPPTWWESHVWSALGTTLVVLAVALALVRLFFRPRLSLELEAQVLARAELEKLRSAPDNETTAAAVGRHLRCFTQARLVLPPGELTTDETLRALANIPKPPPPALADGLAALLRECDARRFAPVPPAVRPGLAARALEVVAQIESFTQPTVQSGSEMKS